MDQRRIAALGLLERLRRHEIEDETRELGRLHSEDAALLRERGELEAKLAEGAVFDDPAMLSYLGSFVQSVHQEIERVEQSRARIAPQIGALEGRVAEAFREIKTYELLKLDALAQRARDARERDEAESAELALGQWWRRQTAEG